MPNPPEPDRDEELTKAQPLVPHDSETETVVIQPDPEGEPEATSAGQPRERRFTAPGFDAKETAIIATPPDRKSTRLNSSHVLRSRMPSSA